ncbi:threonine synthase [Paenibacillus sp. SYP-B4298]|uniref:threonine synthase n=1 Tax=Paenibacillus sp. SYP-B4298 TaxID=2996034 RepID=UPI0022DD6F20|nr:threonine synthase [Paenibacillus sp. SYP-B4298]
MRTDESKKVDNRTVKPAADCELGRLSGTAAGQRPFRAVCWDCGCAAESEPAYLCLHCGGSLDIHYDYDQLLDRKPFGKVTAAAGIASEAISPALVNQASSHESGIWRYRSLLPIDAEVEPVSLGEGCTPLLNILNILNIRMDDNEENTKHIAGNTNNVSRSPALYLKMESQNPTLAFKDRPLAVALTAARAFGFNKVVCASTGNTGVSASAYAARAGLACTVYVPAATPQEKLAAMQAYGACIEPVEGSFSDAYARSAAAAEVEGAFNLTSTYLNPYAAEGDKTVAYELAEQLEGRVPDWIIVPIGAGPLLSSIYKGYRELLYAGVVSRLPRMAGVQALGCAPIAAAYEDGLDHVAAWDEPIASAASGIADPLSSYPADGTRTLAVIRQSGGVALAIGDDELMHWRSELAMREGILAELSSVTSVAAASRLAAEGIIKKDQLVVAIVTGHGLKDMSVAINNTTMGVRQQ